MRPLYVEGHSGFGDAIHERAPVRKLLAAGRDVWLTTAAPCVFHDLACDRLHLLSTNTTLRTHARNIARERALFTDQPVPKDAEYLRASYGRETVLRCGSVLAAMCEAFGVDPAGADFRMPVPGEWRAKLPPTLRGPYVVFRPAVERHEWGGAAPRNPEPDSLLAIFEAVRAGYKTVSVADLAPGREWLVGGEQYQPEVGHRLHAGELDLEGLAALVRGAAFVVTTPGLLTVLSQAVGTPCITVFGGFETAASYGGGAGYAPWLPIEPIHPCGCWQNGHNCDKRIVQAPAIERAQAFVESLTRAEAA